ncbi:MAG: hypothetical protein J6N76_09260, partial [Lachnospiraceae bacterium]|nr:hypothetical protein [Lachnospiraceae bacterium]
MLLDGEWELEGRPIRVPFAPQSKASGYTGKIGDILHYNCSFRLPSSFIKEKTLLHFGAIDQIAEVYINGRTLGRHEGGYLSFCYDITDYVKKDSDNRLEVIALDTLSHHYPYGKQKKKPGGMWYTEVSGIWQSVWLENVPASYLTRAKITPDTRGFDIKVLTNCDTATPYTATDTSSPEGNPGRHTSDIRLRVFLPEGRRQVVYETVLSEGVGRIDIEDLNNNMDINEPPRLWTPDFPYLYELELIYGEDRVSSYTALREISVKNIRGKSRVCLNGKPIFLHGLLDQGYFYDGIYTASSPEAYEADIVNVKALGYNFLRKHIKIEPEAFYYAADALGILVMQDMVNSGPYEYISETIIPNLTFKKRPDTLFTHMDRGRKDFFIQHCYDTINQLYNHPCIIAYTIFNEGWGQFESDSLYEMVREWDNTRLIDSTSGWFAQKKSDFKSEHIYFNNV